MVDDLLVARNPEPDSRLPYLVRIPLGSAGVVIKTKEPWPRAAKVYCHRAEEWPDDAAFSPGRPVPDAPASSAEIRAWARSQGIEISDRGRIPADVLRRFEA